MQANGIAMGDSDIYGNAAKASTCAQLFIGNSYANMNAQAGGGSTLVSGGGTSFVGTMRRLGQCQSDDYDRNSKAGTTIDTAQQVSDIIATAAASGVTDLVLCSCCGSGPMAYKLTWWTSTVYPAIQAYLG
jgi:hypothetical protein